MSLETWKKEFYPTPAQKFPTELEAVEHSLRKWRGLTKENLEKHELYQRLYFIQDATGKKFCIDCTTCALCQQHFDAAENLADCDKCVLKHVNVIYGNHYSCDECISGSSDTIYGYFTKYKDPQPMIDLLEKAKAYLCQNSQQNKTSSSDLKS